MQPTALILAAGKSTRMVSDRPKPLHEVCGKPMLGHILDACYAAGAGRILVVVGHGKEEIIACFGGDERITFVEQTAQLGTGHAVQVCVPHLREASGDVLILTGDLPLIRPEVLTRIRQAHRDTDAAATMGTAVLDNPFGYGRIERDAAGNFLDIVEQIDATPEQAAIREVFPSLYCCRPGDLIDGLSKLKNDNKKGEFYLTDLFGILRREGKRVTAVQAVSAEDIIAPNTREQLAEADAVMQGRIRAAWMAAGATVVGPSVYIEADATAGRDAVIRPFCFIGRGARIGANCTVGPFALVPRDAVVPDGTSVPGLQGSFQGLGG